MADIDHKWKFWKKAEWGLRSPAMGAELHFKKTKRDNTTNTVNVHIDLNNPGKTLNLGEAIDHNVQDEMCRATTHTLDAVRGALLAQGIFVHYMPI